MTVIRNKIQEFAFPHDSVVSLIRKVLSEDQKSYKYAQTEENVDGTSIKTRIKPNLPLLLSTQLFIEVDEVVEDNSSVTVKTKSQWYILGDIFNRYNKYIREFLEKLENELKSF